MDKTVVTKNVSRNKDLRRFAFDNSAKFYPVIASKKFQSLYSIGVVLVDEVDPIVLKIAVNDCMKRFPSIAVSVKKGFIWHYLLQNDSEVELFSADKHILQLIDVEKTHGYMFRLSYEGKRVRLDMFHGITDGTGAVWFLKAIIYRYRQLKGVVFEGTNDVMKVSDKPTQAEVEDSFVKYYKPVSLVKLDIKTVKGGIPLRLRGTPVGFDGYKNIEATANINELKTISKQYGVTMTVFIAALLAKTIESLNPTNKKPIVVMIPVNLRKIFPSVTMRNFVTFARIIIKPKQFSTLQDYCTETAKQLKEKASEEKMQRFISTSVRGQSLLPMRIVPLFFKGPCINLGRAIMGSRQTIIFSNVGAMETPKEMGIERYTLNMNVSRLNQQNLGAISVGEEIGFNFTRVVEEGLLTDTFFENLKKQGLTITEIERTYV